MCIICLYGLNIRAKISNLEQPTGKPFPPIRRFDNKRENLEKRSGNEPTKFDTTRTLLAHIARFPPKNRSDNFRRILKGMKGKDLRKLASNATDELFLMIFFSITCLKQTKTYRKSALLRDFGTFP